MMLKPTLLNIRSMMCVTPLLQTRYIPVIARRMAQN